MQQEDSSVKAAFIKAGCMHHAPNRQPHGSRCLKAAGDTQSLTMTSWVSTMAHSCTSALNGRQHSKALAKHTTIRLAQWQLP